jgi:hypothetical protein
MASIEFLDEAKWALVGLDLTTRFRLAADIDRLADEHRVGNAQPLAGTRHVYRATCGGRTILYHERAGRLTILVIR